MSQKLMFLERKRHKERRDSFVMSAYLSGRCLEKPLNQIRDTKIHAPWTRTLRHLILGSGEFSRLLQMRTRASSSGYVFVICCFLCHAVCL